MVSGKTIVILATVPWSDAWQRQQEWARQFATHNRVLYVSPFGSINHGPLWLARKALGLFVRRTPKYVHELPPETASKITHLTLVFIPWHNVAWINRLNAYCLKRQLRKHLPPTERDVVLWACNPVDTVVDLVERFPRATVVYDIAMRFAKRLDAPSYIVASQDALARRADLIVHDNEASLHDLPITARSKAHFVPQGVRAVERATEEHRVLANIPHPRIGYIGAGHDAFDAAAVRAVIDRVPNAHVMLAGIYMRRDPRLNHPRVHYVGALPVQELPALLAGFDVGLIPYLINEYTVGVFPTKFFEYVAAGVPVVSTELPELRRYGARVTFTTRDGFPAAVKQALATGRQEPDSGFLAEQSWDRRFSLVDKLLGGALDAPDRAPA